MVAHAHILDTAHSETVLPRFAGVQDVGHVTQTAVPDNADLRVVRREWGSASPGQIRDLMQHYDDTRAGAFEITLLDGSTMVGVYVGRMRVTQAAGGFGTVQAEIQEVRTWD